MTLLHRFISGKSDGPDTTLVKPSNWNDLHFGELFNFTFNGDFEVWGGGTTSAPTGWTVNGSGLAFLKDTTAGHFKYGAAAVQITPGSGTSQLTQDAGAIAAFGPAAAWGGRTVTFGCWVRATTASNARIGIDDGAGATFSAFHSGNSALAFLTVTKTLQATPTVVKIILDCAASAAASQFDGAILCNGVVPQDFVPSGWIGRKAILALCTITTIAANATQFWSLVATGISATEAPVQLPVPFKGVARNLSVASGSPQVSGQTATHTVRKNAVSTSLVASTNTTTTPNNGTDTTDEVAFAKGDLLTIQTVTSATAAVAGYGALLEFEEVP